jgi:hypothetical protein
MGEMALARCEIHGKPVGQTKQYAQSAKPVGYPNSAILCGRSRCEHTALIWLDEDDARNYAEGQRDFTLFSHIVRVRVE